ncbi:MAG: WYL domain-containing protein, partial [Ruthenibacterium sp.]
MSKSERQKLKLLVLADILSRETDDTHGLTLPEIQAKLAAQDIAAERKSLYSDFAALEDYGMDLVRNRDKIMHYALAHRTFELPE